MPELPEVETIRRELDEELPGLEVKDVICKDARLLKPDPKVIENAIIGERFLEVDRRAKLLAFRFTNDVNLLCHLRMSGRLLFRDQDDPEDTYVEVKLKLSEGKELRFANARKFGYMQLASDEEVQKAFAKYGPEPFDDLTLEKFKEILGGSRAMIKNLLMDQSKIAGVGNIYANDALFLAKIHPEKSANSLSASQQVSLFEALKKVLWEGLETKGASDQWYRTAHGEKGGYQELFRVYGKAGQPCPRKDCDGRIKRIKVGGRGTFYCPICQNK